MVGKAILTGIQFIFMFALLTNCEPDKSETRDIKRKVDSMNKEVMEQLKKDSANQSE